MLLNGAYDRQFQLHHTITKAVFSKAHKMHCVCMDTEIVAV